jgi:uncharacterized protein (TIGR03083 family)
VLNPRLLDGATRVSPLVVVPETMMRGHLRQAAGAGWALLGDAGHFKHPVTAQGIGDAVQQAYYLAATLTDGEDLSGYQRWRDSRADEHYDWSYRLARFDTSGAAVHYAGLEADPVAGQGFLDTFTKLRRPSEVFTPDRVARWSAAGAYEDGQRRVRALVEDLSPATLETTVPACPEWTVRDLVAHLTGVAEDSARGTYFAGALDAWRDPDLAAARDHWTADQVGARATLDLPALLREFDEHGRRWVGLLRRGTGSEVPAWMVSSPAADLSVHLDDLREALGLRPDTSSPVARFGFAMYRQWLHARIVERDLPALRLRADGREWVVGHGTPGATVTADRYELFRAIGGRRDVESIRDYGVPDSHLPIISPYPLPERHRTKEVAR